MCMDMLCYSRYILNLHCFWRGFHTFVMWPVGCCCWIFLQTVSHAFEFLCVMRGPLKFSTTRSESQTSLNISINRQKATGNQMVL